MEQEKISELYDLRINGTISDFKKQFRKLSKKELVEFLYYCIEIAQRKDWWNYAKGALE